MAFPDAYGWSGEYNPVTALPQRQPDPSSRQQATPEILAQLGATGLNPAEYWWDAQTRKLTNIYDGSSLDYSYGSTGGDPSLGTDVVYGGQTTHYTPEESQNLFFGYSDGGGMFQTADPQAAADWRDDAATRGWQSAARIAALVGGGAALNSLWPVQAAPGAATTYPLASAPSAGSLAAVPGAPTAGAGLTSVGAGAAPAYTGALTASGLPTGAGFAAAPLTGGTGAVGGGLLPGVASGAGGLAGMAAGGGAATNALSQIASGGGSALDRLDKALPYITGGVDTLLGYQAADKAMDAETDALNRSIAEQQRQFDLTRSDNEPWMAAGRDALSKLQNPLASFQASPDYEFLRNEGMRDIGNSFAARGGSKSGNALRALADYQTGLAGSQYNNWFGNNLNLAGLGSDVTRNVSNLGQINSSNRAGAMADIGASRSSGLWNRNASLSNGINGLVGNYLYSRKRP